MPRRPSKVLSYGVSAAEVYHSPGLPAATFGKVATIVDLATETLIGAGMLVSLCVLAVPPYV